MGYKTLKTTALHRNASKSANEAKVLWAVHDWTVLNPRLTRPCYMLCATCTMFLHACLEMERATPWTWRVCTSISRFFKVRTDYLFLRLYTELNNLRPTLGTSCLPWVNTFNSSACKHSKNAYRFSLLEQPANKNLLECSNQDYGLQKIIS